MFTSLYIVVSLVALIRSMELSQSHLFQVIEWLNSGSSTDKNEERLIELACWKHNSVFWGDVTHPCELENPTIVIILNLDE